MANSAEYFAGYFDGEGCVWAGFGSGKQSNCLQMKIRIGSCDLEILKSFQTTFGGTLKKAKRNKLHHKQSWDWHVCGKEAEKFANEIVEYCISKKPQLEAFLKLRKLVRKQGAKYSVSEINNRKKLVLKIKELKLV